MSDKLKDKQVALPIVIIIVIVALAATGFGIYQTNKKKKLEETLANTLEENKQGGGSGMGKMETKETNEDVSDAGKQMYDPSNTVA